MISVVLNTCSGGPVASQGVSPSNGRRYLERYRMLKDHTLPLLAADPFYNQIIVVGEFEDGRDWTYVRCPSEYFNCRDVLRQRHEGQKYARHDVVLFLMDDHAPDERFAHVLKLVLDDDRWDVLSPYRLARTGNTTRLLNDGWADGYYHAHGIIWRRRALDQCPYAGVTPIYQWDRVHSWWAQDRGLVAARAEGLNIVDLEESA